MVVSYSSIIQIISSQYKPLCTKDMMPALKHIYSLAALNNVRLSAKIIYYSLQICYTVSRWIKQGRPITGRLGYLTTINNNVVMMGNSSFEFPTKQSRENYRNALTSNLGNSYTCSLGICSNVGLPSYDKHNV